MTYTQYKGRKHTGRGDGLGSDVVQLDDVAALAAALDGAFTGNLLELEENKS
jgi:hypothetical protein